MNNLKKVFQTVYQYWMKFAYCVGEINFKIIFSVLFFALIGIYSIIKKIFNLFTGKPNGRWLEKKYVEPVIEILRRQF